jgi:hypothetical protein
MKIGTKVTIPMGMFKGTGVIVGKKGTSARPDEVAVKHDGRDGEVVVVKTTHVKKREGK